ncbi:hypothetical protein Tco_0789285 [Tanacetum coccineum]
MDDPNITIEEYIMLEEEKDRRRAIVFNDTLTSEAALSCEPTVSSLNNDEIDFRISFDESDDEDCTVIFDKNSFSYKIIYVNNLKTDSENDNDKVNMHLLPIPKPTVRYFNDLDFFKDYENEFSAIVYNDALTSLSPQHIDEFDLNDGASLFKCDEEEQNFLYFNDLFSFNVIYPDDSKSDKDNDDDKIDIENSSGDMSVKLLPDLITTDVGAYSHRPHLLMIENRISPDPDRTWVDGIRCATQISTLPTKGMRSIISTVSISLEDFMSSILLRMVIIVAVVIVTVIWVVIFVNVIVGVVIVVAIIGVVVFVRLLE